MKPFDHEFRLDDGRRVVLHFYSGTGVLGSKYSDDIFYDVSIEGINAKTHQPAERYGGWNRQMLEKETRKEYGNGAPSGQCDREGSRGIGRLLRRIVF